uniref:Uncharacterized protein n=1 Tax=Leptobrachium leishanense TaxID=445787 RepID=A0A8C5MMH4_9ANUR
MELRWRVSHLPTAWMSLLRWRLCKVMAAIVPKTAAPWVDFCSVDKYYYIVRADLSCYMRSTNFNKGEDLNVFSLHPSCGNGDHYLAHEDDLFYIIKGTSYRHVSDMSKGDDAVVYSLHPSCQGGDHYLSAFGKFYIIYQSRGVYHRTKNMATYEDGKEYSLHNDCKDGLYYFGVKDYYYFVKPLNEWGVQYSRCTNFNTNERGETFSFHPSVIGFLPGGLGITHGPSAGVWNYIKTIRNDSQDHITWTDKVSVKQGFDKEKMLPVENNWNISPSVSGVPGRLATLLTKSQFFLSTSYGGFSVNTDRENWNSLSVDGETVSILLDPGQEVYVWQYSLNLGSEAVLFCRDLKFEAPTECPTENPLLPAKH